MAIQVVRLGSPRFSAGCHCADERRCHRSLLREQLAAREAALV